MNADRCEEFPGGSLRITAEPWVLVGDEPPFVPVDTYELFGGPAGSLEASAQELAGMFGETERRRLAAAQAAATSAVLYAGGAGALGFQLLNPPGLLFDQAAGGEVHDGPLPVLIAAVLAGQLAKDRVLRTIDKDPDPRRLLAATLFGGSGLAHLPAVATEPVALLYGEAARTPDDWPGRAVHIDYLREEARAWITANSERIDALAERAFVHAGVDAATIEQVLAGDGAGEPLHKLAADHPLRRPTPIPSAVIETVADYWSAVVQRHLASTAQHRSDTADDEQQVELFRRTLAEQIASRIEHREPRGVRRIQTADHDGELYSPYSVGVRYELDAVIQDALNAAGLYPGMLFGQLRWVEFDRNTVTEYRSTGSGRTATVLWEALGGRTATAAT